MKQVMVIFGVILSAFTLLLGAIIAPAVDATALPPDWMNGAVHYDAFDATPLQPKRCVTEYRKISPVKNRVYDTADQSPEVQVCVYKNKGYQYAEYTRAYFTYLGTVQESGVALSRGDKDVLVPSRLNSTVVALEQLYTGSESDIYVKQYWAGSHMRMALYRDILSHMQLDEEGFLQVQDEGDYSVTLRVDGAESPMSVSGVSASTNGEFLVFNGVGTGYGILNLANFQLRMFAFKPTSHAAWPSPSPLLAVDDSGNYVAVGGLNVGATVYTLRGECGVTYETVVVQQDLTTMVQCPSRDLFEVATHNSPVWGSSGAWNLTEVRMSHLGDSFSYFDGEKWCKIYAPNYSKPDSMAYVALGDSFTSGEGDYAYLKDSHYLPNTNVLGNYGYGIPRELCHLSDRSYPFLLGKDMNTERGDGMQSIACSGAVRFDIADASANDGVSGGYLGQNIRLQDSVALPRLQLLEHPVALQTDARANFIPGRVQQIEYVKKYHPKVATVGISGNDMGFGEILQACLLNSPWQTCDYAKGDGLSDLGNTLRANYSKQLELYLQLKAVSPGTDFYAVGYPQFLGDDALICWSLGGALNAQERTMITSSISYINQTIRNAASAAGIKYINIENALDGNKMCGEQSGGVSHPLNKAFYGLLTGYYLNFEDADVTDSKNPAEDYLYKSLLVKYRRSQESLWMNPLTAAVLFAAETFHPNATGHQQIYNYIHTHQKGTSLLDVECDGMVIVCPVSSHVTEPALPSEFGGISPMAVQIGSYLWSTANGEGRYQEVGIGGFVPRNTVVQIRPSSTAMKTVMNAKIVMHSIPTGIGDMQVEGGSLMPTDIIIPNDIEVGYHRLIIDITLSDGQSARYIQPLFIIGSQADIDGDGIGNHADSCQFIIASGRDDDSDGIDNECDNRTGTLSIAPLSGLLGKSTIMQPDVLAIAGAGEHSVLSADFGSPQADDSLRVGVTAPFFTKDKQSDLLRSSDTTNPTTRSGWLWVRLICIASIIMLAIVVLLGRRAR